MIQTFCKEGMVLFDCHKFTFYNHSNRVPSFIIQRGSLLTSHGLSSSYSKSNQMMVDPVANGVTFSFAIFLPPFPGDCQHFNCSSAPESSTLINWVMAPDQRVDHSKSTSVSRLFVFFTDSYSSVNSLIASCKLWFDDQRLPAGSLLYSTPNLQLQLYWQTGHLSFWMNKLASGKSFTSIR